MSSSSVTLFYGLWVETWSLAFAADAYAKVHPTLLAIDLICARRRRGELRCAEEQGETTAVDLPVEVWELVKQQVIDQAVDDAEQGEIARKRCPNCRQDLGEELSKADLEKIEQDRSWPAEVADMWATWEYPQCAWCFDHVTGYEGLLDERSEVGLARDRPQLRC